MDNIYIHHNNEQVGPFTEEKIRRYLEEGRIQPTTLAWVDGAADWKPIAEMLGLASTPPPPVQAPPRPQAQARQQQGPAYAAPQSQQPSHQANPKKLILASWLMIGVTCLVALIPGIGFLTWIIAFPILLITFILGIITLTKGRTTQGVMILLTSLIAAPVFLVIAPIITTAGAVAASDSASGRSISGSNESKSPNVEAVSGDLKAHIVGYWKSVKKNDLDDTYLYKAFSETEYFDIAGWIPYKVVGIDGNELTFAWSQDSGALGEFDRKTRISFFSNDKMRIDYDRFSEGYVYEKISEEQWLREKKELDDEAIQQLRQKIGETIRRLDN